MVQPRRILVVKLATLGDLLTITPALRALRTSLPQAHIGVLTTPAHASALRGLDSFDETIAFDKYAFDRPLDAFHPGRLATALDFARTLRDGNWDTLLLLHHLTTSFGVAKYAALALLSGAERRVGLDNGRGRWFLTESAVDHGFGVKHEVDYWLNVVGVLGARHPGGPRLELCIAPDDDAWAESRVPANTVLIVPGSGAYSTARRWSPERFAAVGRTLAERHGLAPVVLSGTAPDEEALAHEVAKQIGAAAQVAPAAPGPQALGAFVRRCRLVVANDGGVVHVATAVGTPVVAIFGPSNDLAWGPYPPDASQHQVVREHLVCTPCIHRGHSFGTPWGCPARTCLALVEANHVVAAAERALFGAAEPRQTVSA